MTKTWLITGAGRGLGAAIARAVLDAGHQVVATARNPATIEGALGTSDRLLAVQLDVTKPEGAEAAVAAAKARFGRIDVLVNNAGYGQLGWFETISDEQIRRQFETNVFGAMHVARAVLPLMRAQRSGHVFTISSIAGLISVAGSSIYAASKFAVEGWMEGLAQELKPLGINATVIEPGFFKTDFLDASSVTYGAYDIGDYAEQVAKFKAWHDEMNHQQVGDPAKLGTLLLQLSDMAEPPVRLAAGSDAAEWAVQKGQQLSAEADTLRALSDSTDSEVPTNKPTKLPSDL
jgi:NAD(P)-dependent dehydrogenase (short-subunit alcohol dehydrogenase family)